MSCPSNSELCGMLDGNLPTDRFDAIFLHVDGCIVCQDAVRELGQSTPRLAVESSFVTAHSFADEDMCRHVLGEIEALNDVAQNVNMSADVSSNVVDSATP